MGFALLPFALTLVLLGLGMQAVQLSDAIPGAGPAGQMDTLALVHAQQAEMFSTACVASASALPGVVSASIVVTLPNRVSIPNGAVCMTTADGSGRSIYAYSPLVPGEAGNILTDTMNSVSWFQVRSVGTATNLVTGEVVAIPSSIPASSIVDWVQISS